MSGTRDQREAWNEVGREFGELGRVLRAHLSPDAARSPSDPTGGDPTGGDPWADATRAPQGGEWGAARDSVRRLGESAQRLAAQTGDAARDPEVRDTAGRAARTLGDAITTTVETVTAEFRDRTRTPRHPDATPPPEPPPVAPLETDRP